MYNECLPRKKGGWVGGLGEYEDGELPILDTDATLESHYGGQST